MAIVPDNMVGNSDGPEKRRKEKEEEEGCLHSLNHILFSINNGTYYPYNIDKYFKLMSQKNAKVA